MTAIVWRGDGMEEGRYSDHEAVRSAPAPHELDIRRVISVETHSSVARVRVKLTILQHFKPVIVTEYCQDPTTAIA